MYKTDQIKNFYRFKASIKINSFGEILMKKNIPVLSLILIILFVFLPVRAEEALSPEVQNAINGIENTIKQFNALIGDQKVSAKKLLRKTKQKIKQEDMIKIQESIEKSRTEIKKLGKKAVPDLEKIVLDKGKEDELKNTLIDLLVELGDEEVADTLITVGEDKGNDYDIRRLALFQIGELNRKLKDKNKNLNKKYISNLKNIFDDDKNNMRLRESATSLYGVIGQNEALPVLKEKLYDTAGEPAKYMSSNALYGIGAVRTPEGEKALMEGYLKQRGTFNDGGYVHLFKIYKVKEAVPYLIEELEKIEGNSINISAKRGGYIEALGEIGDISAIPILKEIAGNKDISVNALNDAEDAAIALTEMGDYETIKKIIKKLEIDGRGGKGSARRSRNIYKRLKGEDFNY